MFPRLDIELEGLVITRNLIEVSIEKNRYHMIEFTCKKDGNYDFSFSFEIHHAKYSYAGQKFCDMKTTGQEGNVSSNSN